MSGSLDLTHRCNLRCVHCYLGNRTELPKVELSAAQWISILDAAAEAGCLYLLLTGGEPMLRDDFAQIYTRARTNGMVVTVFTNGTWIPDEVLNLFQDIPPLAVEISLYGATAETFDAVTGVSGSYRQCMKGIEQLLTRNIRVKLKTVLMTCNAHEFHAMKQTANHFSVGFRSDPCVFPRLNGDKTPLRLRIPPDQAVEIEFSDTDSVRKLKDFFELYSEVPSTDDLYQCGAGMTTFHVDPFGSLRPCLMADSPTYDLLTGGFFEGWKVMSEIREKKMNPAMPCRTCKKAMLCDYCPGFFKLENGTEDCCSEYLCAIGQTRFRKIRAFLTGGTL